jgi:hypothetical protein
VLDVQTDQGEPDGVSPGLRKLIEAWNAYCEQDNQEQSPEQIASELIELRHLFDRAELRFADKAALLARSDLWEEWGSTSPVHWIRHNCKMSTSAAADRLNVGQQIANLPKTVEGGCRRPDRLRASLGDCANRPGIDELCDGATIR